MRREAVAVLTRGTLCDADMLAATPDAAYLLALAELPVPQQEKEDEGMELEGQEGAQGHGQGGGAGARARVWVGACAVDVATGQVLVGQWLDDDMRTQARLLLRTCGTPSFHPFRMPSCPPGGSRGQAPPRQEEASAPRAPPLTRGLPAGRPAADSHPLTRPLALPPPRSCAAR